MENFIRIYENAYSTEYCNQVIEFFELACAAGHGFTRQQYEKVPKHIKNDIAIALPDLKISLNFRNTGDLTKDFLDPFINKFYDDYISTYSVLANDHNQTVYDIKIQKTMPGGGYHVWHAENSGRKTCARLTVFSLYLNTIDEGGETEFLYYGLRVKPKQGTLIIWPAGFTHAHRGNPPLQETKYIVTGWVESDTR